MSALHIRSNCLPFVLPLALFACVSSKPALDTQLQRTRTYASVRVLNLVADTSTADTIISVADDLPGGFSPVSAPGVSPFQPVAAGDWTAWLSQDGNATASSDKLTVAEGQKLTLVQAGLSADGATPPVTLLWKAENFPTLGADQIGVRLVAGAPSLVSAQVNLGTVSAIDSATLGAVTDWSVNAAGQSQSVVVSLPGQATRFDIPAATAGTFHTLALVQASPTDTSLRLIDFSETAGTDAVMSAPIEPTP